MFGLPSSMLYTQIGITVLVTTAVLVLLGIVELIGMWCLLQKMGRHDFAALVPGYNVWEYARGAGFGKGLSTFLVLILCVCIGCFALYNQAFYTELFSDRIFDTNLFLSLAAGSSYALTLFINAWTSQFMMHLQTFNPLLMASLSTLAVYCILNIVASYGVSKSFGHGIFFVIGMIILPFIFIPVLGCSKRQKYQCPYFDKELRGDNSEIWSNAVRARLQTFGSNAPLALSIIGLLASMTLGPFVSIIICVIALVKNTSDRGKPLSGPKRIATIIISTVGIVLSAIFTFMVLHVSNQIVALLGIL